MRLGNNVSTDLYFIFIVTDQSNRRIRKYELLEEEFTTDDYLETNCENILEKINQLNNKVNGLVQRMTIFNFERTVSDVSGYDYFENLKRDDNEFEDIKLKIISDKYNNSVRIYTPIKIIRSLKKHLSLVSYFNGSNRCVESFINDIEFVLNLLSIEERCLFVKLVYSFKVIGEAKNVLNEYIIQTVDSFFELLRMCYGNTNTFLNSKVIRKKCVQGIDSITTYNKKFEQAQLNVIRAIWNNGTLTLLQKSSIALIENRNGLQEYIAGLNNNFKALIQITNPRNLHEAQIKALDIEKIMKTNI
ncbi:hypothetical protein M0802_013259 [Mischocyttarus mexicanus]|nr:hypothetical protein M0802_013269 [Mischocyttarus mexicanus]KAI4483861.1 hypothetical protein M0802_013259 [Mischocyttarus mexicanus]